MTAHFQFFMILGAAILLLIIFALLKKGQMSVKYSLLWLALAVVLVIFAVFPYVVYVLRDLLDVQMPVNLVFMLMFCTGPGAKGVSSWWRTTVTSRVFSSTWPLALGTL